MVTSMHIDSFLQWSHPLSAVEIRPWHRPIVNCDADTFLQWSHPLSAVEITSL